MTTSYCTCMLIHVLIYVLYMLVSALITDTITLYRCIIYAIYGFILMACKIYSH